MAIFNSYVKLPEGNSGQLLYYFLFGHASGTHGLLENPPAATVDVHGQLWEISV